MEVIRLAVWVVILSRLKVDTSVSKEHTVIIFRVRCIFDRKASKYCDCYRVLLAVSLLMCAYTLAVKNSTVRCVLQVFRDFQCLPKDTRYVEP
jgi:hypothetical protein